MPAPAPTPSVEEGGEQPKKKKSRKLLFIVLGVLVLALASAAAAVVLLKQKAAAAEDYDEEPVAVVEKADAKHPPIYLPLDSMVVNLADPGGARFAQLGITLKLQDEDTAKVVKSRMPSVRNSVLILVSQRTAEELLSIQGKQKLVADIIQAVSREMGYGSNATDNPVQDVLFSGFLVQ